MLDATRLCQLRWRKKKVESFIIPPTFFRRSDYSIVDSSQTEQVKQSQSSKPESLEKSQIEQVADPKIEIGYSEKTISTEIPKPLSSTLSESPKFSAMSLSSIRAKKELLENTRGIVKEDVHLPSEAFSETDMLLHWTKYAEKLGNKGHKIVESLMLIGDPKLEDTSIVHELPNESTKIEFESEKAELLGYLRGKLQNHNITIDLIVNEKVENKFAFTPKDKYNRMNEINPNLDLLKKTFDLDI